MYEIAEFQQAIDEGRLLKINYQDKQHPIESNVIRPIRIDDKNKLMVYNYASDSERILAVKRITDILTFEPEYINGIEPDDVKHFRWLISNCVVSLFNSGWLISTDDEYLGIYPRSKGDTVETNKGYAEKFAYLQYLKSKSHQFHTWFKDGHYYRFSDFYDALDKLVTYAKENPKALK